MVTFLNIAMHKLRLALVLSSLACTVHAHEILPAIANMSAENGRLTLIIDLNLEAQLSDIDLDSVANTDDSENTGNYSALRAEPAINIAARAGQFVSRLNAVPMLISGETAIPFELVDSETDEVRNPELPRLTRMTLAADLPSGVQSVQVTWPAGSGPLVLRQRGVDKPYTGFLERGATTPEIDLQGGGARTAWQAFAAYIPAGFEHFTTKGFDYVLFVLSFVLLSMQVRPLLWQIGAFTLAHSLTLAAGALGWVQVPLAVVSPLLAVSIIYLAFENVVSPRLSVTRRSIIFAFGLLHGLGFASALTRLGLPETHGIPALLGFNVGLELGQLAVIAAAGFLIILSLQAVRMWPANDAEQTLGEPALLFRAMSVLSSLGIAAIATYWLIERTLL